MDDRSSFIEQAAVLALVSASRRTSRPADRVSWHRVADLVRQAGSALKILNREWTGFESSESREEATRLAAAVRDDGLEQARNLIEQTCTGGITLVTVLDPGYPRNLLQVYDMPPFLWIKGRLEERDQRAIAVVGTRKASEQGRKRARRLARQLAERGVTVLSGLALGIDAAAHEATLRAGGRTVAVIGTGIHRVYPAQHEGLAQQIADAGGALVSPFWPDEPPTKSSFPMRNAVMSGMAIGTAVIEASHTSGAKMQARLALEHGKRLFLLRSLVAEQEWARKYAKRRGALVVDEVEDIVRAIEAVVSPPEQLSLA